MRTMNSTYDEQDLDLSSNGHPYGKPINRHKRLSSEERKRQIARESARLIAYYGSYGVSMQTIADAVGLTLPGLYHYVRNREELLSLIIEVYYDQDTFPLDSIPTNQNVPGLVIGYDTDGSPQYSLPVYLSHLVKQNSERMVLVMLFMRLAIEAHDPQHPAHDYYQQRHAKMMAFMESIAWKLPTRFQNKDNFSKLVKTVYCTMDGVQIQALTNSEDDIIGLWQKADSILFPSPEWDDYR